MSVEEMEPVEEMAAFFDARADGYDVYMRDSIFEDETFDQFYEALSAPIGETNEPLQILDLGCGTGLELKALFQRAPNAFVTGIDVSEKMLELLKARYDAYKGQISLVSDSFLTRPLASQSYDYVLSGFSMHHVLREPKLELYKKIRAALKPGGKYVEGDSVIPREEESQFLAEYQECAASVPPAPDGWYHIDVPFSLETQRALLLEAGFRDFQLIWTKDPTLVWNIAVYAVTA
jgi:tRNA (cmo5U34)-methyltransferase